MTRPKQILMKLTVNGRAISVYARAGRRLLDFLREDLHLTGTKEGCGEGECGSCTVLLDGVSILSCLTPMEKAIGRRVTTVEGLGTAQRLHPMQKALVEKGGIQCGMCTPGMVLSGVDLLNRNPHPTKEEIVASISGNLCRCTGYQKIIAAVEQAAAEMADTQPERR
jgi:aerobic-type carbon monoxide dehydrogenase small subunit (CoxS/CutS family)